MGKLKELLSKVKCSLSLEVNRHRDYYESIEHAVEELIGEGEIDEEMGRKMIEANTLIYLCFYPDTPIGSYTVYGYDLDLVLYMALRYMDGD